MEASELKIGNFVQRIDDRIKTVIVTVVGIHQLRDRSDEIDTAYVEQVNPIITVYDKVAIDQIQAIPLTEEWLLKFGFEKHYEKWSLIINTSTDSPARLSVQMFANVLVVRLTSKTISNIKYVHQLQNLHFTLTGEELTIK